MTHRMRPAVTALLKAFRGGDDEAGDRLLSLVHESWQAITVRDRRRARARPAQRRGILLHEAWVRLREQRAPS